METLPQFSTYSDAELRKVNTRAKLVEYPENTVSGKCRTNNARSVLIR